MHLVNLNFWQKSKLQFVLMNRTFLCKLTSSDMFYHDFIWLSNYLDYAITGDYHWAS